MQQTGTVTPIGFNPESYIQAIIADFDLPLTYEDVLKRFGRKYQTGITLQMLETNNDN
jgi:hypothetical protein